MSQSIVVFLIRAKQATYAGKGSETTASRTNSHDLIYQDGDLTYYDTYLGSDRFMGEEALWIKDKSYWGMNYAGRALSEEFTTDFLREALRIIPPESPFRGPARYSKGDHVYTCSVEGTFDWFRGKETVSFKGKEVYECYFHGGLIE